MSSSELAAACRSKASLPRHSRAESVCTIRWRRWPPRGTVARKGNRPHAGRMAEGILGTCAGGPLMPQDIGGDRSIGERIAHHRKNLGLTQEGLAMRLFRSKSWVTKIERGERPLDSVRTLVDVARALGVQVRDLTGQPWF